MRLTVLGNSSRYLLPLGTGATYLIEHEGTRLLVDPGNGSALRLAKLGLSADGVLVSHFHSDCVMDLIPVLKSLAPGTNVFLPERAKPRLNEILHSQPSSRAWAHDITLRPLESGSEALLGPLALRFARTAHDCPGVAMRVEPRDAPERALCYTSDTGWRPWLADLARGAALVVAHALLLDRDGARDAAERNLTAGQAGRLAAEAGAGKLGLLHVPLYGSAEESVAEARSAFPGDVIVLREGASYDV